MSSTKKQYLPQRPQRKSSQQQLKNDQEQLQNQLLMKYTSSQDQESLPGEQFYIYQTDGGYYYLYENGIKSRISQELYINLRNRRQSRKSHKNRGNSNNQKDRPQRNNPQMPQIGDMVEIIIKPYKNNVLVIGVVKRVLTKKQFHSRGHKVELENGVIGRLIRIIKKSIQQA